MLEEKDSHEGPIRFLAMFQHAVQSPLEVKPTERPFHFPPLAAGAPVVDIFRRTTTRNADMILAIRGEGNNAALAQGTAMRIAIVAFVQPQAVGFALTLADADAINRLQQFAEVITVGFTEGEVERIPISVDNQMAFEPFNPVFSGVPDLGVQPFLDFTTLAS